MSPGPARPAPESSDDQGGIEVPAQPHFRITGRTYSGNAEPLVDVLLMLYDWSIERTLRARAHVSTGRGAPLNRDAGQSPEDRPAR